MRRDDLRQLAGLKFGWHRIISNVITWIVSTYKTITFLLSAGLIILGLKLGILRK